MRWIIATILCCFLPTEAFARDWPSAGWFEIVQSESGCGAFAEYSFDGRPDVKMMIGYYDDGDVVISITSLGWSAEKDQVYEDIKWNLGDDIYSGKSYGIVNDYIYKGFMGRFSEEILIDLAAAESLFVTKGDAVITHINLHSSAKAIDILRQCQAVVAAQNNAKRERESQWDYIDKDPFK